MKADLEEKIKLSLVNGGIPCVTAWAIADETKTGRKRLGENLNELSIRVHDCQLGAFGTKKATHEELVGREVNQVIADKIETSLKDGRLPCAVAFKIAETLQVAPMEVGDTATLKETKISKCQLGCFP